MVPNLVLVTEIKCSLGKCQRQVVSSSLFPQDAKKYLNEAISYEVATNRLFNDIKKLENSLIALAKRTKKIVMNTAWWQSNNITKRTNGTQPLSASYKIPFLKTHWRLLWHFTTGFRPRTPGYPHMKSISTPYETELANGNTRRIPWGLPLQTFRLMEETCNLLQKMG